MCNEIMLTFVLPYFRPWGKRQVDQLQESVFPFAVLSWRSWFLKVFVHQKEGTILLRQRPISLILLQMSKSHSSTERTKHSPSKTPKSKSPQHATPSKQRSAAPTIPGQTETAFHHIPEPRSTSTQPGPSSC